PDVVVARLADLDDREHYLLTAGVVVEVLSPGERIDKRPFYRSCAVAEVVLVDPAAGTVEWSSLAPDGSAYEPVKVSAVLGVGPESMVALLAT
ncbi:MAG: Uma2 family endonuclease, partial [Acidimicrobiales bacterium]